MGFALHTPAVQILWEATSAPANLASSGMTLLVKIKMNVRNTTVAQRTLLATTLLEVIVVHVTQDSNLVVEGQHSRAWENPVKMWMSAPRTQLFVAPP